MSITSHLPAGYNPEGTKNITENGEYDIKTFANVNVAVPSSGIIPTGVMDIIANGNYDISEYAGVNVNVPTGGGGELPPNIFTGEFVGEGTKNAGITVNYSFPSIPKCIIAVPDNPIDGADYPIGDQVMCATYYWYNGSINQAMRKSSNSTAIAYTNTACTKNVTTNGFELGCVNVNTYFPTVRWHWVAWC